MFSIKAEVLDVGLVATDLEFLDTIPCPYFGAVVYLHFPLNKIF